MKNLIVLLFIGTVFANSIHYYGWKPQLEITLRFETKVLSNVPEINRNVATGLRVVGLLRIQTQHDYSFVAQLENPRFLTTNGKLQDVHAEREEVIPAIFRTHLEKPFKVELRRGVVEAVYVEMDEPVHVTNIKKAIVANLNMDISASRRAEITSNSIQIPNEAVLEQAPLDQSYFSVREQSLHGDCETAYTIHEVPQYEAMEIEDRLIREEKYRSQREHLAGGLTQAAAFCKGKKYWQITKTRNFDNCLERPVFQRMSGLKSKCDASKAGCEDLMTHISSTNYLVCGNEVRDFIIRKSETFNDVALSGSLWKTDEQFLHQGKLTIELVKVENTVTPIVPGSNLKKLTSLIFQYPKTFESSEPHIVPEQAKIQQETGIKPIMPMPELKAAPKMMLDITISKPEIIKKVLLQIETISTMMFMSPESCPEQGDVAGQLNVIAKVLRTLSYDDLKEVESKIMSKLNAYPDVNMKKTLKHLFYDGISMVGTNPAVMLVKERVKDFLTTDRYLALKMLQTTLVSIRTPTPELLKELVTLIKHDFKPLSAQEPTLYNVATLQVTKLVHKACICPLRENSYPIKIYGPFCTPESPIVMEFIKFLEQELEQQTPEIRLNMITALGKLGHIESVKVLSKIISKKTFSPMVRSLAVYGLKKVARIQPTVVRPLLLTIIDNVAEAEEVRIAAVAILPWTQPTTAELQKIAVRTWFEPSKQVASFIYTTFHALSRNEIPELKILSEKVVPLLTLVKPFELGLQYSKHLHDTTFVKYLDMIVSHQISWTKSRQVPIIPARMSFINKLFSGSFETDVTKLTVYNQGMDKLVDEILLLIRNEPSQGVMDELTRISNILKIKQRKTALPLQSYMQVGVLDFEFAYFLDEPKIRQQVVDELTVLLKTEQDLEKKREVVLTHASRLVELEGLAPSDTGFAFYHEASMPVVSAFKGEGQIIAEEQGQWQIPRIVKAKILPVINAKLELTTGVISPLNQFFIGTGSEMVLHASLPLDLTLTRKNAQIAVDIKTPEQIKKEVGLLHVALTPFTVRKNLREIVPMTKATDFKPILSGEPLKEAKIDLGRPLELDVKLVGKSDAKFVDLYSYVEKIRQHCPISLMTTFYMPSTIRMGSLMIRFNPQTSKTKEIAFVVSAATSQNPMEMVKLPFSGKQLSDAVVIKDACEDAFGSDKAAIVECVSKLKLVEVVDQKLDSICHKTPFPNCFKYEKICDEAKKICETKSLANMGPKSRDCQVMTERCMDQIKSVQPLHQALQKMEVANTLSTASISLAAGIRSQHGSKRIHAAATVGWAKKPISPLRDELEVVSILNGQVLTRPVYEILFISKTEIPRVANRWTTNDLVEEAIELVANAGIQYGYEKQPKSELTVSSKMLKTQEQITSVKQSPEYLLCLEQERLGLKLTSVCEFIRHQAASIDELRAEIAFPEYMLGYNSIYKVTDILRAYFMLQMTEDASSHVSKTNLKLVAKVKRTGEEAQLIAEIGGRKYQIYNIRMPRVLKAAFPISLRNPLHYTVVQKITRNQIPASCRIEPTYVSTFDNKTYDYQMGNCYHLLFKDCSEQLPVAVLAKNLQNTLKEVKVLAGESILVMTPRARNDIALSLTIDGAQQQVPILQDLTTEIKCPKTGNVIIEIKKYKDNVYYVRFVQERLLILFDGENIEVSPSQFLKARACGLCGDLDHENTADLKTPQTCLTSKPKFAAYSYMLLESCSGIPSQDKTQYDAEIGQCARPEIIPTNLEKLTAIVARKSLVTKPLIAQHVVKKESGKTCISVQRVKVCSKINNMEMNEPKPVKVVKKLVQYVCLASPSISAQSLEQRALAGEPLDMLSIGKPITYANVEYEPVVCQRLSNHI
jgi:hypothetical protein